MLAARALYTCWSQKTSEQTAGLSIRGSALPRTGEDKTDQRLGQAATLAVGGVALQPNQSGWFAIRGSARQGKMQDKQGRDGPLVPGVMPEVAVQSDGGLRRPAQEAARPATATSDARTALEAALSARVAHIFYPPPPPYICSSTPRLSDSRNPLPTAYLPLHSAPVMIERGPSGPRSPSETSPGGLRLLCSAVPANPAGFRPDGASPLGTDVPVRRPAYVDGRRLRRFRAQPMR